MLTFYYGGYRAQIDDTGRVEYARMDDLPRADLTVPIIETTPVVVTDPPASVMAIAAAVLPLVSSDVMKADLRVKRIEKELQAATGRAASEALTARFARAALFAKLKAAEGALQLARVSAVS